MIIIIIIIIIIMIITQAVKNVAWCGGVWNS